MDKAYQALTHICILSIVMMGAKHSLVIMEKILEII
jgi:hypothetical protein